MTTVADWIAEVRDHLDADRSEQLNKLAESYTAGSGTVSVTGQLGAIQSNATLSAGLNVMRVWEVGATARTVTVTGGMRGSPDEDAPAGTIVRVNPRFTDHSVLRALKQGLSSLSSPRNGIYRVVQEEFTYNAAVGGYDLPGDGMLAVLSVRSQPYGPVNDWPRLQQGRDYRLIRPAPLDQFPSGVGLNIVGGGNSGRAVQVAYRAVLGTVGALSDDVAATGLLPSAYDLPPLAAAIRLMAGREVARNADESQPNSRRAEEVPPGAVAASYRGLAGLLAQRINEEASVLLQQYGASV